MKRLVVVGLVLGLSSVVLAGPVTTPPFPAIVDPGSSANCAATNIGTTTSTVTFQMIGLGGTVLGTEGPDSVAPNHVVAGIKFGAALYPIYCSFTFKGKFKGSFQWVGSGGSPVVVVPATK